MTLSGDLSVQGSLAGVGTSTVHHSHSHLARSTHDTQNNPKVDSKTSIDKAFDKAEKATKKVSPGAVKEGRLRSDGNDESHSGSEDEEEDESESEEEE